MFRLEARLKKLADENRLRNRKALQSAQGRLICLQGRTLLNFSSNDYLGLAAHPALREVAATGVGLWGVGSGASQMVCGYTRVQEELEFALAQWLNREAALIFSSGYLANLGVINALCARDDWIIADKLNHASLVDGAILSRAHHIRYRHGDAAHCRTLCAKATGMKLIATESVFSMDGDIAPLAQLKQIATQHDACLMVDDAHALGVVGPLGKGLGVEFADVLVGTFGKAFGTMGAFVAGGKTLIEYLVQTCRTSTYSTALPPVLMQATLCSLDLIQKEHWRREKLFQLLALFRELAEQNQLSVLPSQTPIQPVMVGDAGRAVEVSQKLSGKGLYVCPIRPPTVPQGTSRLRIVITAAHEPEDIRCLVNALVEVMQGFPESSHSTN